MKRNVISKVLVLKFLFLVVLFTTLNFAQAQKVEQFSKKINQLSKDDAENLRSLANDLQPSTSVTKAPANRMARMSTASDVARNQRTPKVAHVDAENLSLIDQLAPSINSIELLRIKVSSAADLGKSVDLSTLVEATNLKYVLFIFEYNGADTQYESLIKGIKGLGQLKVPVLYEKSIPQ